MNKNVDEKNKKRKEGKKKKSFLSGLIQVEETPPEKEDTSKEVEQNTQQPPQPPEQKPEVPQTNTSIKKSTKKKSKAKDSGKSKDENGLTEDEKLLLNTGEGVNLIPKRSKAEITKEKKKFSFSITSMISLLLLILLSLGVVFFNIISKRQLNSAKESLSRRESELETYTDKMVSNEEILVRVDLYRHLQESVFSPKEIVQYILGVVDRSGNVTIRDFVLGDDLDFEMSGGTTDLSVVARLWYLLGIDDNIITVNLNSVGKGTDGVSFSFEGQLNTDKFLGK
jgi:hypothetical protein